MSSISSLENSESFSIKKWLGVLVLIVTFIVLIIMYEYEYKNNYPHVPPRIVTLQGTLTPLSPENSITYVTAERIPSYRIVNQIDQYKEVYILSNSDNKEIDDLVAYAQDKIICSGKVKFTGREVEVRVTSGVIGGSEGATGGETQILIDRWECVK